MEMRKKKKGGGAKNISEKIIAEIFPNLGKGQLPKSKKHRYSHTG